MMERFDVRLAPEKVDAMRRLARKMSLREDRDLTWADLLRLGAEMVMSPEGERWVNERLKTAMSG